VRRHRSHSPTTSSSSTRKTAIFPRRPHGSDPYPGLVPATDGTAQRSLLRVARRCELSGRRDRKSDGGLYLRCGQKLFTVVMFRTPNQQHDGSWLGLAAGATYKEICQFFMAGVSGGVRTGAHQWGIRRGDLQRADFELALCRGCGAAKAIDDRTITPRGGRCQSPIRLSDKR
jgi:hypothetical protein